MASSYELKPNKTAFVNYRFGVGLLVSLILFIVLYFVVNNFVIVTPLFFIIVYGIVNSISYYSLLVNYKKEKYTFLPNKIIRSGGGIFSDFELELIVRNITHITMRLPFIEYKLLQTGNIMIESAGTGITEVYLSSIDNPKQTYDYIEKIMRYNGFKLTKSNLIQQEQPHSIGVFFETLRNFIALLFLLPMVGLWVMGLFNVNLTTYSYNYELLIFSIIIFFIGLLLNSILNFLDLKNRVYNLYEDTITYSEGFLTKNFSYIPVENLSDSSLNQTFIDKIFGLYDVKISCQGTNQEIHFKNMVNGTKLKANIERIIPQSKSLVGTQKVEEAQIQKQEAYKAKDIAVDKEFTAEYKMDGMRTLLPIIIFLPFLIFLIPLFMYAFPLFFLAAFFLIIATIAVKATTFYVKKESMEEKYNFISQKTIEFANEKIMAIVFKESFIDKWFNTCSIHFWSIGSAKNIVFSNIKKTPGLYESILSKSGIRKQDAIYKTDSSFNLIEMLKSGFFITILSFIAVIGFIVAGLLFNPLFYIFVGGIIFIYLLTFIYLTYYYKRSKMSFHEDYVYFTKGIFFVEHYYALYNNIKDKSTLRYPFSKVGSITYNVAGEHIQNEGKKNQSLVSNSFTISFIENIEAKDELIDMILLKRPSADSIKENYVSKTILLSKPEVGNSLVVLIGVSIVIFPLIILLPITIPLVLWSIREKSYAIQQYRVIGRSGIFYKKQISVLYNKIDHINQSQGMLNKMFNNGNISVNTVGSSMPELIISDIQDYKEFYEELKKYY